MTPHQRKVIDQAGLLLEKQVKRFRDLNRRFVHSNGRVSGPVGPTALVEELRALREMTGDMIEILEQHARQRVEEEPS